MTEETKPFTVSDRRHFTPEGVVREEASAGSEHTPRSPDPTGTTEPAEQDRPIDFAGFLLSLGAQAGALLSGGVEGIEKTEALREARALIGILEMLKDKTEGRRTPEEDRVLDGLLYELRMAYVAAARETGA
jgi:hypothetical protein